MNLSNGIWLSILLPMYNVEPYIASCLNSIFRQTGDDHGIEIIIVDDGSTDRSRDVVGTFCRQYPKQLKLVCLHLNEGVSVARNRLLDESHGEYIWFVDPDDYILDGAVEELRAITNTNKPDLIMCDYRKNIMGKKKAFFGPAKQLSSDIDQLVAGVFRSRKMYCWLKISRRSLWGDGLCFPAGKVFEDIATTPWLLLRTRSYYYAPRPWVHYRRRSGSIMDSVRRQREYFDEAKHRDLAQSLIGFKKSLSHHLPGGCHTAEYYVSDFCAKEFTKTAYRMVRTRIFAKNPAQMLSILRSLQATWQSCSPIAFEQLAVEYAKKLRFIRYGILIYFLHLTKRP